MYLYKYVVDALYLFPKGGLLPGAISSKQPIEIKKKISKFLR